MAVRLPKKILVTGGAGFLGSHLCRRLLAEGAEVTCLDNLFTGSKRNIGALTVNPAFTFVLHDVTQPYRGQFDEIYNLACPASPIHYQKNPVETVKTSVLGMINMLDLARDTGAKLLHTSTSEIYGDPLVHPQVESYWGNVNTIGVRSCYDEGKRVAETLAADYRRAYGVDVRMVRIFNTYGPNMHPQDGRVISNFAMQALANAPITIYGDGSQTRSFQYCDDLIEAMVRTASARPSSTPATPANTRSRSSPKRRSRSCRTRPRASSTRRCPATTRSGASPTSRSRRSCSAGSRRSRSTRGSPRPSTISARHSASKRRNAQP